MTSVDGIADPAAITTRDELAAALTALRTAAGLSVRDVVSRTRGPHGTISGWFAGAHAPLPANRELFTAVLRVCGVRDDDLDGWHSAAQRSRRGRVPQTTGDSPYRGLLTFEASDNDYFYGRTEVIGQLRERVASGLRDAGPSLLAVVGASGSGKSSLLRAGLVPALDHWQLLVPGAHPTIPSPDPDLAGPLTIIIDQFEQIWTECRDDAERAGFFAAVQAAAARPATVVVLGLRADFFGIASGEGALLPALQDSPVVVGPMGRDQLRSVIVDPAAHRDVQVDEALVELLLTELGVAGVRSTNTPGALPLLSHALLKTWQHARRKRMTVADYFATGGIGGAVEASAERAFTALTPSEQQLARRLLLRLVTLEEDVVARARVDRAELVWPAARTADTDAVIERFTAERLLTVSDTAVEISHEVLLRAWPRFAEWIETDRAELVLHRRLTLAARSWQESRRSSSELLTASRLDLLGGWAREHDEELNTVERDFLAASTSHHAAVQRSNRRRVRTLRRLIVATAMLAVAALVLAGTALVAQSSATTQRRNAEAARDEALSRQAAMQSVQLRGRDPALAQQLALAGYRLSPTLEARSALLDSTAVPTPRRLPTVPGPIASALSPDQTLLAVANSDGTVRLIDRRETGRAVDATFTESAKELFAVAFSPDGRALAVGGVGDAALWDLTDPGRPHKLGALAAGTGTVYDLAWSPDGRELAAATSSGVTRWATSGDGPSLTATAQPPLDVMTGASRAVAYSPDGALIAAGGENAAVQLWGRDGGSPQPLGAVAMEAPRQFVLDVAFDPSSHRLAVGSRSKEVAIIDVTDPARPAVRNRLAGFGSYVNTVAFSTAGDKLVAGSSDNSTQVWDARSGRQLHNLPGPAVVTAAMFADDGASVIDASVDGGVREWPLPGPVTDNLGGTVFVVKSSGDGRTTIASVGAPGNSVRQLDTADPSNVRERGPALLAPAGVALSGAGTVSRDGRLVAGGNQDGSVDLWDIGVPEAPRLVAASVPAVRGLVGALAFSPDQTWLAVGSPDTPRVVLLDVHDPAAPRVVGDLDAGGLTQLIAISPDGSRLAVATAANDVALWDVSAGPGAPRPLARVGGFASAVQAVTFSPDGHTVAAGSADKTVRLWELAAPDRPRELARLTGPSGAIYSLTYNQVGTRLAAGTGDQGLWIWDTTESAQPNRFAVLEAYPGRVNDVAFGPDDRSLSAAGPAATVRTWAADADVVAEAVCSSPASALTREEWEQYLPGRAFVPPCP